MKVTAFDTLSYANKLKAAGVEPKNAEMQSEATAEILDNLVLAFLATKNDLRQMEARLLDFILKVITGAVMIMAGAELFFFLHR